MHICDKTYRVDAYLHNRHLLQGIGWVSYHASLLAVGKASRGAANKPYPYT